MINSGQQTCRGRDGLLDIAVVWVSWYLGEERKGLQVIVAVQEEKTKFHSCQVMMPNFGKFRSRGSNLTRDLVLCHMDSDYRCFENCCTR